MRLEKGFMKSYKILTLVTLLCAFFIAGGCGGSSGGGKGGTEVNIKVIRTPTETYNALMEATRKKDPAEIKKLLSKGTLVQLENAALAQNTTSDELLRRDSIGFEENPELVGEKIVSDTLAYVEIKNEITKENEQMPLVKEDGEWKVAIDLYLKELEKRFTEDMNKMPSQQNPATPSSNSNIERVTVPKNKESNSAANKK